MKLIEERKRRPKQRVWQRGNLFAVFTSNWLRDSSRPRACSLMPEDKWKKLSSVFLVSDFSEFFGFCRFHVLSPWPHISVAFGRSQRGFFSVFFSPLVRYKITTSFEATSEKPQKCFHRWSFGKSVLSEHTKKGIERKPSRAEKFIQFRYLFVLSSFVWQIYEAILKMDSQ